MSGSKPLFAAGVAGGGLGTAAATAFDTLAAFLGGAGAGIRCVTGVSPVLDGSLELPWRAIPSPLLALLPSLSSRWGATAIAMGSKSSGLNFGAWASPERPESCSSRLATAIRFDTDVL